jgi:hypothetical protein
MTFFSISLPGVLAPAGGIGGGGTAPAIAGSPTRAARHSSQ